MYVCLWPAPARYLELKHWCGGKVFRSQKVGQSIIGVLGERLSGGGLAWLGWLDSAVGGYSRVIPG